MAYTPPAGESIEFRLSPFVVPAGDDINFVMGSSLPVMTLGASLSAGGIRIPYGEASAVERSVAARWRDSGNLYRSNWLSYADAEPVNWRCRAIWHQQVRLERYTSIAWARFDEWFDNSIASLSHSSQQADLSYQILWDELHPHDCLIDTPFASPPPLDAHLYALWDEAVSYNKSVRAGFTDAPSNDEHLMTQWGEQAYQQICYRDYQSPDGGVLHFNLNRAVTAALDFKFDSFTYDNRCSTWLPSGWRDAYPTVQVVQYGIRRNPVQEVYIIMNAVIAVKLPERTPVELGNLQVSHDRDSWAWGLSADVLGDASINLLRPDLSGNKEIEIEVNGWFWVFVVDGFSNDRQFAGVAPRISAKSKTVYLAAPNQLPRFYTEIAIRTANQLADQEVTPHSWLLNWNTVDWTVPAGAHSYSQKTPIQAVSMIAGAVGARIFPHRTDNTIDINPAHPISPWGFAAATPDGILTNDVITRITERMERKPSSNGVYVSGQNSGVSCFVKRAGSAGDELLQSVVDPLIVHQDAGRERGRNFLADTGLQEIRDIYLPLMPPGQEPGLFVSGDLLEIDKGAAGTWRAEVEATKISTSISADEFNVDQVLTLKRYHL
jgi:hypothetical protein